MYSECEGFQTDIGRFCSLFYADDGLILAESVKSAERSIEVVMDTSRRCGLEMNRDKTYIPGCNIEGILSDASHPRFVIKIPNM